MFPQNPEDNYECIVERISGLFAFVYVIVVYFVVVLYIYVVPFIVVVIEIVQDGDVEKIIVVDVVVNVFETLVDVLFW